MLKYNNFLENLILENILNESIIYLSPDLKTNLKKLKDNEIAKDILSSEGQDIKADITFVDLDKEGYFSFSTMRNAKKIIMDKYPTIDYLDTSPDVHTANDLWSLDKRGSERATGVYTRSRNPVSIGKFVNKLFPGKYSDKDREDFVNKFKSIIGVETEEFRIVSGKDIEYWYNSENYKEQSGNLGNSCMSKKSGIFDLYTKNPDICKMLILVEDGKLLGRALLWKVTTWKSLGRTFQGPEWFMDRQYTIKDSDVNKFRDYAVEKGWAYKTMNNHHSFAGVTIEGEKRTAFMTVQVNKVENPNRNLSPYDYRKYPYVDTFRRYDVETGILYNDDEEDNDGQYLLDDTGGGYTECRGGIWSDYYGENIPEDESIWSERVNSYIWADRIVRVEGGHWRNRGIYPDDYDDIVEDGFTGEWYHIDDTVWSEAKNYNIFVEDAVRAIEKIYSDGSISPADEANWYHKDSKDLLELDFEGEFWFDSLSSKFSEWSEYEYVLKDEMVRDIRAYWIPKRFAIEVWDVKEASGGEEPVDLMGIKMLMKEDAKILGYDIDKSGFNIMDSFYYQNSISRLLPEIKKRLSNRITKYDLISSGKSGELPLFSKEDTKKHQDEARILWREYLDRLEQIEEIEDLLSYSH